MRKLALLLLLSLVAVGCSRGPAAQGTASAAATASSSPTSPAPASPPPVPTGELLYAVLEPWPTAGPSTFNKVAIAGLDGIARAKTTFTPLTPPFVGCAGPTPPPPAYAVGGKVYFADGAGTVRSLDRSGAISVLASFPIGAQQELSFAVSPDATRLLATVLTLPPKPAGDPCSGPTAFGAGSFVVDTYSVSFGSTPKLLDHQSTPYVAGQPLPPVLQFMGWDAVGPTALYPTGLGTQGGGPTHWFGHPVRTDTAGRPLGDLGGAGCNATDDGLDGTVACAGPNGTDVKRPDGSVAWHSANSLLAGRLSPDGRKVVGFGDQGQVVVGADGSTMDLFGEFFVTGWLDPSTLIGNFNGGEVGIQQIAPTTPKPGDQGYAGVFVGVVQHP